MFFRTLAAVITALTISTSLLPTNKPDCYILIHGTFASPRHAILHKGKAQWYQPGHVSFQALKKATKAEIIQHTWSGKNNLADRIAGAQKLYGLLKKHSVQHTIHIIAHSHGGNVALLALDLLARETTRAIKIKSLVLLGTPICYQWYPQAVDGVQKIYNLFSYGDLIQPVAGMYERVLPELPNVHNIQLKCNTSCPQHNQLYSPELMQEIPQFAHLFRKKENYCLHCTTGKKPLITHDANRAHDLQIDKKFTQQLMTSFSEIRENHAQKNTANYNRITRFRDRWTQYYKKTVARLYNSINTNNA